MKQPGSTVQILGAEKALFRVLKTKHATPKYGIIYHASLIGKAAPKLKGKISRSLAAKVALAVRYDALGDGQDNSMGLENRAKLEARLRNLEGRELGRSAGSTKGKPKIEVYDKERKTGTGALITAAKTYNPSADAVLHRTTEQTAERLENQEEEEVALLTNGSGEEKKKKKDKVVETNTQDNDDDQSIKPEEAEKTDKKEKKKNEAETALQNVEQEIEGKKQKKKRKHAEIEVEEDTEMRSKKKGKKKEKKSEK